MTRETTAILLEELAKALRKRKVKVEVRTLEVSPETVALVVRVPAVAKALLS